MPSKDMAAYMKERRWLRRVRILEMLGDQCSKCYSSNDLEVDHIDPATKKFQLSGSGLDRPWHEIVAEVAKCQLLCKPHHEAKTSKENREKNPVQHGTEWMYAKYKCRCNKCKTAYSEARKKYPSRIAG